MSAVVSLTALLLAVGCIQRALASAKHPRPAVAPWAPRAAAAARDAAELARGAAA